MTPIENILIKLLQIPSPTGHEEAIGNFIIEQLKGFIITKQVVAPHRFNVVATKGTPYRWLVAHMDTVPGTVPIKITPTKLFGRGACDNKQSVAAAIVVGQKLHNIGLLFTVGEEHDFIGAKAAQAAHLGGKLVIVQEPTQGQVITGQRGVISCIITTTGTMQHSSLPNPQSAIHDLVKILEQLRHQKWTAFNIGKINGGVAENVVADTAQATIVVRPINVKEHHAVLNTLKKIAAQVTIQNNYEPFNNKVGFPTKIGKGFAETFFFKNSIKFGAGNIRYAHSDHEHILRQALNAVPEQLVSLLEHAKLP